MDDISKIEFPTTAVELVKLIDHRYVRLNEKTSKSFEVMKTELKNVSKENVTLLKKLDESRLENNDLRKRLMLLESKSKIQERKQEANEALERGKNIIIRGVPEKEGEPIEKTVTDMLGASECGLLWTDVVKAYRVGKKHLNQPKKDGANNVPDVGDSRPRNIKLHLKTRQHRGQLFSGKKKMAENDQYVKVNMAPDHTSSEMLAEKTVQQLHSLARAHPDVQTSRMRGTRIEINGKTYGPADFDNIEPKGITPESAATRVHKWGTSFQGHNAPLSNFFPCKIISKNGKAVYNSAEQYYCAVMAMEHKDTNTLRLIEQSNNPYYIKAIAKNIHRTREWNQKSASVMEGIMRDKFMQNPDLKQKLLSYKGEVFRECTKCPRWGSGRYLESAHLGETELTGYGNQMGNLLRKIRDSLK